MVVLVTVCKNEEDPVKWCFNVHNIIHRFFKRSRVDYLRFSGGIWQKFKLIHACMHVLVPCKKKDDSIKNKGAKVVTRLFPLKV